MIAKKDYYTGIALAVLATLIWSGNFVIARGVNQQIPPVSLAFYRWSLATVLIAPLAIKKFRERHRSQKLEIHFLGSTHRHYIV